MTARSQLAPQKCPGKSFAYTEIKMVTLAMLERYDVGK
jgi:cytochrome P450